MQLLDRVETVLRQVAQREESIADLVVGDREDRVLGLIEDDVGVLFPVVRGREDLVRREDQVAERRLLFDDPRVVLDVGRSRHAVHERRDVGRAADLVELARTAQLLFQRDEIDGVAPLGELHHLVEDAPVGVAKEVRRVDHLGREVERVVVEENRAEHGSLGFEIVWQRTFCDGGVRHRREAGRNESLAEGAGCGKSEVRRLKSEGRSLKTETKSERAANRPNLGLQTPDLLYFFSSPPSAITRTFSCVVTSRCSFTGTLNSPSFLIGSCSTSLRLSRSKPFAASACTLSPVVTEP